MPLSVGEIVHHEITSEEGRIIRIVKIDGQIAYVVEVANKATGKNIEALWWTPELSELREVE